MFLGFALPGLLKISLAGWTNSFVREPSLISSWLQNFPENPVSHSHSHPASLVTRFPISHSSALDAQGSIVVFRTGISLKNQF